MSTQAEKIVSSGSLPTHYQQAADEITTIVVDAHKALNDAPKEIHASGIVREEDGTAILDESGQAVRELLYDEKMEPILGPHPLWNNYEHHGLHAYRYEEQDDGSVLAIYANDESGEIKLKAFEDIAAASLWSPRNERE